MKQKTRLSKWVIAFSMLPLLAACNEVDDKAGFVTIEIGNSRAPAGVELNAAITPEQDNSLRAFSVDTLEQFPALQVDHFKVTVAGLGIDPSLEISVDSHQAGVEIEIPPGPNRSFLIEAYNSSGQVIRRRKLEGITIHHGVITPIKTTLNTVPLLLNFRPGSVVLARNFRILGFGEPGTAIKIQAESNAQSLRLNESIAEGALVSPSLKAGLFEASPAIFLTGKQKISLTDENTGESSEVSIYVVAGNRPGTKFVSTSSPITNTTIGTGLGGPKGIHFPAILRALSDPSSLGGNQ